MKRFLICLAMTSCLLLAQAPRTPAPEPLWPNGAPGAQGSEEIDIPTLAAYPAPEGRGVGTAVIVCPGGGYLHLSMDKEGDQIARWLNSLGVTAFVLKYRLGPKYRHPIELGDAQRAIRTVRYKAAEYHVAADRIGIMGFSAGGHLASTAGTHFDAGKPDAADPIDRMSSRPDFLVLCYPVISFGHVRAPGLEKRAARPESRSDTRREPLERIAGDAADTRRPSSFTPPPTQPCRWRTASSSTWPCARPECRPKCTSTSAARMASDWRRRTRRSPPGRRAWPTGCASVDC